MPSGILPSLRAWLLVSHVGHVIWANLSGKNNPKSAIQNKCLDEAGKFETKAWHSLGLSRNLSSDDRVTSPKKLRKKTFKIYITREFFCQRV